MITTTKLDAHSATHFVGCYALVATFVQFGLTGFWAAAIALALGVGWEMLDELNWRHDWQLPILDRRGGDWLDIAIDFLGILLAYVIFR